MEILYINCCISSSLITVGDLGFDFYRTDFQNQSIAYSLDEGKTWTKYAGNPVLKTPNLKDFRDPKVFRYQDHWIMCAVQPWDHKVSFYKSSDLITWQHLSDFGPAAAISGVWECPDLFPLTLNGNECWVLLVSLNPGGLCGSGTQYFVGDFVCTATRVCGIAPND